jgi:hypothetical protein
VVEVKKRTAKARAAAVVVRRREMRRIGELGLVGDEGGVWVEKWRRSVVGGGSSSWRLFFVNCGLLTSILDLTPLHPKGRTI